MLTRVLVVAAVAWPLVAGVAVWHRVAHPGAASGWVGAVYFAAGQICHQKPERSFETRAVAWPVCARCTGLYLAAPLAAVLALRRRRGQVVFGVGPVKLVALAAVPTVLTLLWEWGGLGTPPNLWRFVSALPLGAGITIVLIHVTSSGRVH
jgi:uncharacterized membrane protein